jgi:hypothetical protein
MKFSTPRLGKSEKGVYCAYRCTRDVFQIWFLNESHGHPEWVLKSNIDLKPVPWRPRDLIRGSWILPEIDGYRSRLEENSEWDPNDKDVVSIEHWVGTHGSKIYDFLGFHPYKEIVILTSKTSAMAYHMNTSNVRDLGHIYMWNNDVRISFPYTPCWAGPLPGASKYLIDWNHRSQC